MGCTTSASTGLTPDENPTGQHIKFIEEIKETKDVEQTISQVQNQFQDVKGLPICDDTLEESTQLVRNNNNKTLIHISTIELEKDCQSPENVNIDSDNFIGERITSMEKIVDKVIEIKNYDINEKITQTCDLNNDSNPLHTFLSESNNDGNDNISDISENDHDKFPDEKNITPDESREECPEEAMSPSQSESSRATRWEALADIAAELPPSHTVDPITGQIYSLAK